MDTPQAAQPRLLCHLEATPSAAQARRLKSADLFGAAREVMIDHGNETYRLRKTRLGKLILTK